MGWLTLFAITWFVVDAHKWFKGPRVNIEHTMIGQDEHVLEGKAGRGDGSCDSGLVMGLFVGGSEDKKIAAAA